MAVPVVESYEVAVAPNDTDDSVTITKPSGTVEGDLLLACISMAANEGKDVPSGWTAVGPSEGSGGSVSSRTFYKVATGSEPSNYTFGGWSDRQVVGEIWRISGIDTSTPINVYAAANSFNVTDPVCPTVTTTVNDCLVARFACKPQETTSAYPSGTTGVHRTDSSAAGGWVHATSAYEPQVTAGATGTATFTGDGATRNVMWTVAIAPAAAVAGQLYHKRKAWHVAALVR